MKWHYTLDIKNEFKQAIKTNATDDCVKLLEKIISGLEDIQETHPLSDYIQAFIDDFDLIKNDLEEHLFVSTKEFFYIFNHYMNKLYDWADCSFDGKLFGEKNCWIITE